MELSTFLYLAIKVNGDIIFFLERIFSSETFRFLLNILKNSTELIFLDFCLIFIAFYTKIILNRLPKRRFKLLILTEKPSVAQDFATALNCNFSGGAYKNSSTVITYCMGHLFKEEPPQHYSQNFPVIPETWDYKFSDDEKNARQAKFVLSLLKNHQNDTIIIATDADREGEIIARECLLQAHIFDISKIKRFWVSQALTRDVIIQGLKNAKPLSEYNFLAQQGFARQHADWLFGMNFCRYISNIAKQNLSVGRVQTAILSAIEQRCLQIKNFKSEKYFEHYGIFQSSSETFRSKTCKGIYFENEKTSFPDDSRNQKLKSLVGKSARLLDRKTENKISNPPQLYNLNAIQKDAFKLFGYSVGQTLKIIQSLYEDLKCVSYPRTPSRVMGTGNLELCEKIADELCESNLSYSHPNQDFKSMRQEMDISLSNKKVFNDAKLEAHHALIPLKNLQIQKATQEQINIFGLILDRFFEAFLPPCEYEKQTFILDVDSSKFKIIGNKIIKPGWKKYILVCEQKLERNVSLENKNFDITSSEDEQNLDNIDWNNLALSKVETEEKWSKPSAFFNEASILSFMENPKILERNVSLEENPQKKLVGLGTAATRHTFIPLLLKRGYIEIDKKNIVCTQLGSSLLKIVRNSSLKPLADISLTTTWEENLNDNPKKYLEDIKTFVCQAVNQKVDFEVPIIKSNSIICPICKKEIRKGKSNWYCSGYKDGCKFVLWENVAGAKLSQKDVESLCNGKQTGIKHCINKIGKKF